MVPNALYVSDVILIRRARPCLRAERGVMEERAAAVACEFGPALFKP